MLTTNILIIMYLLQQQTRQTNINTKDNTYVNISSDNGIPN